VDECGHIQRICADEEVEVSSSAHMYRAIGCIAGAR
jgi:hypothetical protein